MRSDCKGLPSSGTQKPCAQHRHRLHGRPGSTRRMASDDPGPGQQYAIMARKHIATLRRSSGAQTTKVSVSVEWAKLVAGEPDAHGLEWFTSRDPSDQGRERKFPLPRSLINFSEKERAEDKGWAKKNQEPQVPPQ